MIKKYDNVPLEKDFLKKLQVKWINTWFFSISLIIS